MDTNHFADGKSADAMADQRNRTGGSISTSIKQIDDSDLGTRGSQQAGPFKPLPTPGHKDGQPPTEGTRAEATTEPPISMMATQMLSYAMDDAGFFDAPVDKWQLQRQAMPLGVQCAPASQGSKRIGAFAVPLSEYGEWGILQASEGPAPACLRLSADLRGMGRGEGEGLPGAHLRRRAAKGGGSRRAFRQRLSCTG
jgi:hypothetical protein